MDNRRYFSELTTCETICLSDSFPDIEKIISIIVDPQIISLKIIDTMRGCSLEGQHLTGKKVAAEIYLRQKILYAADLAEQSIHIVENECYQSVYVVIPSIFEGSDPKILLEKNFLKYKLHIENVIIKPLDNRTIFKSVFLLLEVYFSPTYELCYSIHNNCTYSNLFLMYEDGTCTKQLTFGENIKNIKPQWSPCGQSIAFLSNKKGAYMFYIVNIKKCTSMEVTTPCIVQSILGFSWHPNGHQIIFSAISEDGKDLFSIDIDTLDFKQLTNGNKLVKSFKPKYSPDGKKIAFLKSISELTTLWVMNTDEVDSQRISPLTHIKDFDWSKDNKSIVFIKEDNGKPDKLCFIDLPSLEVRELSTCNPFVKRKVKLSSDNEFIALIGSDNYTENIFIYNIKQNQMFNCTNHASNINIKDYTWNADSTKIFYSANELGYYNIYCSSIADKTIHRITSTTASNIELNYRTKI